MELREPLKENEQLELLKSRDKPDVKEKLILHNLRLVKWVANKYKSDDHPGRDIDDLFQDGVIGLMNAIDNYDASKSSFAHYAAMHITAAIFRSLTNKSRTIRIPSHMIDRINNYKKMTNAFYDKYHREPTQFEICDELEISLKQLVEIESSLHDPVSLDSVVKGEEGDTTLGEFIPSGGPSVEKQVESKVFVEQFMEEFKEKLPEEEFESIRLFYGLNCPEHSLQDIGKKMNKTVSQVSQIRNKGLITVMQSSFIRELDDRTTWIRGIDYSQPRVTGGLGTSPVERIVLEREWIQRQM